MPQVPLLVNSRLSVRLSACKNHRMLAINPLFCVPPYSAGTLFTMARLVNENVPGVSTRLMP